MGRCYGQLSLEERVEIYRLHAGGISQNQIAAAPGPVANHDQSGT
ncbi:helix-turn-helix domain-containing protein [Bradyrhizobium sp. ERR14]